MEFEEFFHTCLNSTQFAIDSSNYNMSDFNSLLESISKNNDVFNNYYQLISYFSQVLDVSDGFISDCGFEDEQIQQFYGVIFNRLQIIMGNPTHHKTENHYYQMYGKEIQSVVENILENIYNQKFTSFFDTLENNQALDNVQKGKALFPFVHSFIQSHFIPFKITNISKLESLLDFLQEVLQNRKNLTAALVQTELMQLNTIQKPFQIEHLNLIGIILSPSTLLNRMFHPNMELNQILTQRYKSIMSTQAFNSEVKQWRDQVDILVMGVEKFLLLCIKQGQKDEIIKILNKIMDYHKDKLKMQPNFHQLTSYGFSFNLQNVIFRLMKPFIDNFGLIMDKRTKIDFNIVNERIGWLDGQTQIVSNENKNESNSEQKNAFISHLCRICAGLLEINYFYFKEIYMKQLRKLQKYGQNTPEFLQNLLIKMQNDVYCDNDQMFTNIIKFNCFLVYSIYHENQVTLDDDFQVVDFEKCVVTNNYQQIPSIFFEQMQSYIIHILQINPQFLKKNYDFLQCQYEIFIILMGKKEWCSSPHLQSVILLLLGYMSPQGNGNKKHDEISFSNFFNNNKVSQQYIVNSMISAFIAAEKSGGSNQFYDKFNYRGQFCKLLTYLMSLNNGYYNEQFQKYSEIHKEEWIQFLSLYVNDITFLLDEIFEKLRKIKTKEDNPDNQQFQNVEFDPKQELKYVNIFGHTLHNYYENLTEISVCSGEVFLADEVIEKLVANMNYTLDYLNNEDASKMIKIQKLKEISFKPRIITSKLVELYVNFSKFEKFNQMCIKDIRSFKPNVFERTIQLCQLHNLVDSTCLGEFEQLVFKLIQLKEQTSKEDDIFEQNAPEKYMCKYYILGAITACLMATPVKLPSGYIVDMNSIKIHLSNDPSDPFTRQPLKIDDIEILHSFQKEIEDFKKDCLQKIKK